MHELFAGNSTELLLKDNWLLQRPVSGRQTRIQYLDPSICPQRPVLYVKIGIELEYICALVKL